MGQSSSSLKWYYAGLISCVVGGTGLNAWYFSRHTENGDAQELIRTMDLPSHIVPSAPKTTETDIRLADPLLAKKWGIKATDSEKAWEKLQIKGSRDIVVAIIDTGIDVNHVDLRNNLWVNKGEVGTDAKGRSKASNRVDDDGNGYIDDVHGWNFATENNDLSDTNGHGTHIAGIIGAEGGNGQGVSGVAPRVSLMVLKIYDFGAPSANVVTSTIRATRYATAMGAHIINYSGGGVKSSEAEKSAIAEAQKKGVLFVAAAGNEYSNSDVSGYYPADYDLDNIVSVTAIDKTKTVLPSSNYGGATVDIAAPGAEIYSTLPGNRYGVLTGTSQATAYVTGVAALILSRYRDFDAKQVIKQLTETGDLEPNLAGKTIYRKRLNTYRALAILDQGVSVTGAVVTNAAGMSPSTFSLERPKGRDPASTIDVGHPNSIVAFGKSLEEKIRTGAPKQ